LTEAPGKAQRAFLRAEQAILGHDQPAALTTSGPSVAKQHLDHPKATSTEQANPTRIAMAKVTATASPAKTSRITRTAASIQRLAVRQQVLVAGPAHTSTLPEESGAGYNAGNSHNGHAPGFMVSAAPTYKHTRARSLYPACSQFVYARFCSGSCCAMGLLNRTCFQGIQTCFSVAWMCRRRAVAEGLQPRCLHASLGILITPKNRKKMGSCHLHNSVTIRIFGYYTCFPQKIQERCGLPRGLVGSLCRAVASALKPLAAARPCSSNEVTYSNVTGTILFFGIKHRAEWLWRVRQHKGDGRGLSTLD